ncbi:FecR family protein [Candidatus Villigracilis affinis]|jgi:hypothetical protein|uniref:FecR family protein n=1 Tax=Candidatus Villigracilis affinis TaxID=3140682 RepID=UPI002A1B9DA9|nr:FecR domain-containing protein [Anaerolineales bacterium]
MKKLTVILVLLTLLLGACAPAVSPVEAPVATEEPSSQVGPAVDIPAEVEPIPTATTAPEREATISDVQNEVMARMLSTNDFAPAMVGTNILPTGGVETGAEGRARLDLLPEGTIVRVGPNSSFTVPQLVEENGQPKTVIELLFGKVYILLNGGSLEVETPSGVASVRGSLMRVEYDPETKKLKASCLEGHCSLKDGNGNEVELVEGEYTYIEGNFPPIEPLLIDSSEIQEWLDEIPELPDFLDEVPDPSDYPDSENENDNNGNDNGNDNNNNDDDDDDDGGNDNGGYPN